LPERLEKQVNFLDNNPDIGLVGSSAYLIDENGKIIKEEKVMTDNKTIKEHLLIGNQFFHSSVIYRKSIIESIGGYREEFKASQDYDLFLRICERFNVININEFLIKYRINSKGLSIKKRAVQARFSQLAKDLARERRESGKDRIQRGEKIEIDATIDSTSKGYFDIGMWFYKDDKLYYAFIYLVRAIIKDPFNFYYIKFLIKGFFIRGVKKILKIIFKNRYEVIF